MRKDNKFRRETAKKIIELLCEGVPCYEAYEQTSEKGSVRGGTTGSTFQDPLKNSHILKPR